MIDCSYLKCFLKTENKFYPRSFFWNWRSHKSYRTYSHFIEDTLIHTHSHQSQMWHADRILYLTTWELVSWLSNRYVARIGYVKRLIFRHVIQINYRIHIFKNMIWHFCFIVTVGFLNSFLKHVSYLQSLTYIMVHSIHCQTQFCVQASVINQSNSK